MPRIHRLAGALALALAATGTAQAQQFSNVVSFGDSLSDAGNVAQLQGLPAGNSFTTNPDPVAAQLIAAAFGFSQTNASATGSPITNTAGTNYAYGGACIQSSGPCVNPASLDFTRVSNQITTYLSRNNNAADPNALFTLWAGANDIFAPLGAGLWTSQAQIAAGVAPIATAFTTQAARLQAAGANYIVVFNLPDLGRTPQFIAAGATAAGAASFATLTYNAALNTGLASLGDGIIPINTYALVGEVVANPSAFGFSNVTGTACGTLSGSLACGPAGSGLPFTYASGTNNSFLFADGVHPTGAAHRLLSQVVVQTIAAPAIISMSPEVARKAQAEHQQAIDESALSLWSQELESGTVRGYASVQGGNHDIDGDAFSPGLDGSSFSLTMGVNYRMSENFTMGGAISLGNQDVDTANVGNIDGTSVIGSAYLQYENGGFYLRGQLGGGSSSHDISRFVTVGPVLREHIGKPAVEHQSAGAEIGYMFQGDSVQHGPFVAFNWQKFTVEAYREEDNSSTAMNFEEFERKSQLASVGYQITGAMDTGGGTWRPFLRVALVDEGKNEQTLVNAGSNSMNGRFTMAGYTPSEDWYTASLGLSAEFGETLSGFLSLNGHFGDDNQDSGDVAFGVRKTF